jgi:hypothetical protein
MGTAVFDMDGPYWSINLATAYGASARARQDQRKRRWEFPTPFF